MPIVVTVLGLLVALFLGVFIGGSELTQLAVIFGLVALIALTACLRQHIWVFADFLEFHWIRFASATSILSSRFGCHAGCRRLLRSFCLKSP